jgi:predicted dehydrogenase
LWTNCFGRHEFLRGSWYGIPENIQYLWRSTVVNVGQIGVGYWGPNLLRNFVASKACVVRTVVDINQERRDYVKSLYPKIQVTDDVGAVMEDSSIHAVIIATPVKSHFTLAVKALEKGKHVLIEKPMATTVEEVEQIAVLAKQNNLVAMVGHTFLYNPAVRYLKGFIDSGALGDIRYIYSQRLNLGRIRSDVDALWNFAPHDVSIVQYLLNDQRPLSTVRNGMDYVQDGIEDVVFMHILYPKKIMAHIHVSWLDPNKVRRVTVVGSKKMVVYDDIADNKIAIYDKGIDRMAILGDQMDFDHLEFFRFNHRSGDVLLPKIEFEEPLKIETSHFLDCIKNGSQCLTGPEHARNVVEILSV